MSRSNWVIAGCVIAMLGLTGCSSDDVKDALGIDPEGEVAEAAIEGALTDVVDPLATVVEIFTELLSTPPPPAPAFAGGLICPDTTGWCSSDTAISCTVGAGVLEFSFNSCSMSDGFDTATMTGGIDVAIPDSMTLVDLVINGGGALNGTVTFPDDCDMAWDINATNGTVLQGTIVQCDTDNFPLASSTLTITATVSGVGVLQVVFTFNGTSTAAAVVTLDGGLYATCSVNVDTYDTSCDGA